jgi:hypothetical protein
LSAFSVRLFVHLKNEHLPSGDYQINQLRTPHPSILTFYDKRNRKSDHKIDKSHPSQRPPYFRCRDNARIRGAFASPPNPVPDKTIPKTNP